MTVGDYTTGMERQVLEQLVFRGRQPHLDPLEEHEPASQVNRKISEEKNGLVLGFGDVPDRNPDARKKLPHTEGLGEVIVGTRIESPDLVSFPFPHRKDDDGHARPFPEAGDDFRAVYVGETEVEYDQVRMEIVASRSPSFPEEASDTA